jgi:hypothetical protein
MDGGGRTASGTAVDDCMDAGGTTPWMREVERRLEQPSTTASGTAVDDCMDAEGRGRSSASCARDTRTSMCFATQERLPRRPVCLRQRAAICTQNAL